MYDLLDTFKALLLTVDPSATQYFGESDTAYTVWSEYELDGLYGGNVNALPKWRVLVERYTHDANDSIVRELMTKFEDASGITFQYSLRRNVELKLLYHAWDCEVTHGAF